MSRTRTAPISELEEAELEPDRSGPTESGPEPPAARVGNSAFARVVESHPPSRGDLGTPLHPELRSWANQAFGSDLSAVRVHTGSSAEQANREAGTSAYTVGSHIVLGSDNFPLLVHELAHSVQQERGQGLRRGLTAPAHEGLADRAVEGALAGRQYVDVGPGAPIGFAGGDESKQGDLSGRLMRQLQSRMLGLVMGSLGVHTSATDLVQCAVIGFVEELIAQLWTGNKGTDFLRAMLTMGPSGVAQLVKGYYVGLLEGVVSPVTDLFGLAVLAEKIQLLGPRLLASVLTNPGGLATDAQAVATKVGGIAARVGDAWENAKKDPAGTIVGILEAQGHLAEFAKQQARDLGKAGAAMVVNSLTAPLAPKQAEKPPEEKGFMGPFETFGSWMKRGEAAVLDTPWSQIGGKLGYAVGFVAVQIALLLFTEGIGNAIEQLAVGVAKVGAALEQIVKGAGAVVGKVAELATTVGQTIATVERFVGVVLAKALKPLEKILGPVLEPLGEAIAALKKFLENLFGVARKQAAPAVEAAAGKAAASLTDDALRATPKPPASTAESLASKTPDVLEHPPTPSTTAPETVKPAAATKPPTATTSEPSTSPELPKSPEPVTSPEPTTAPEAPDPVAAPESAQTAEPVETAPKAEAAEPPATTAPEPAVSEPSQTTSPATDLEPPSAAPTPQSAAAPPTTQPKTPKPKATKSTTPKTPKPKKPPTPTGDPELDASLARLETDVPPEFSKPVNRVTKRIRKTAESDVDGARRLADEAETFIESRRPNPKVDDEAMELLSGRRDPAEADRAIADELSDANVARQKSDAAAARRRAEAKAGGQAPAQADPRPFEERVLFGELEDGRPTGVIGEVHPSDLHTGSETKDFYPEGLQKGELDPLGARRGHLFGNLFGGSGTDPRNLAWMHKTINNSQFKTEFENVLRKALESGESVKFGVTPLYRGNEKAPYAVEVWMQGTKTTMAPKIVPTPGLGDL